MLSEKDKKQDPRVKRTRQLLQQAFMDLTHEKSLQDITVHDITQRATVNRATFYAHFEDKYALIDACMREGFRQLLDRKLPASATLSPETLRILLIASCEYMAGTHRRNCSGNVQQQMESRFETTLQQEIYQILLYWLQNASDSHFSKHSTMVDAAATAMSWAIFGAAVRWSQNTHQQPLQEMVDQFMTVLLHGLSQVTPIA